jgi:hypothetical protein
MSYVCVGLYWMASVWCWRLNLEDIYGGKTLLEVAACQNHHGALEVLFSRYLPPLAIILLISYFRLKSISSDVGLRL